MHQQEQMLAGSYSASWHKTNRKHIAQKIYNNTIKLRDTTLYFFSKHAVGIVFCSQKFVSASFLPGDKSIFA